MLRKERDKRVFGVQAKGIVAKVNGLEVGAGEEGGKERGEGGRNLFKKAASKDVVEVGGDETGLGGEKGRKGCGSGSAEGVAGEVEMCDRVQLL